MGGLCVCHGPVHAVAGWGRDVRAVIYMCCVCTPTRSARARIHEHALSTTRKHGHPPQTTFAPRVALPAAQYNRAHVASARAPAQARTRSTRTRTHTRTRTRTRTRTHVHVARLSSLPSLLLFFFPPVFAPSFFCFLFFFFCNMLFTSMKYEPSEATRRR